MVIFGLEVTAKYNTTKQHSELLFLQLRSSSGNLPKPYNFHKISPSLMQPEFFGTRAEVSCSKPYFRDNIANETEPSAPSIMHLHVSQWNTSSIWLSYKCTRWPLCFHKIRLYFSSSQNFLKPQSSSNWLQNLELEQTLCLPSNWTEWNLTAYLSAMCNFHIVLVIGASVD